MSAYIAIPARGSKGGQQELGGRQASGSSSSSSSSMASSYSSSLNRASLSPQMPSPPTPASSTTHHYHRQSLLSPSISKQEHTVIDVGHPDGPPRLITCVKASQGFDWNQGRAKPVGLLEIFLPSRSDPDSPLETRKDPVHEILLTDSEIESMFPQ
ncbi:MAG: hypothetical protein M1839_000286 [Geoglossum umbratile]|nr:MAG: hypothetical protein M1839_000286 [Geoglossum umbratile]